MSSFEKVKAWKERVIIPTYEVSKAETYPIFLEKRVYQGSSGSVYPNPVIEKISDEKIDKEWDVIYLENRYIKIMVLPALGGRIQMAYDKVKQRHFVYYNEVIKPALVGLTGPWISGGIEFNWPQHHRPSTYDPVDSTIEENADGSVTVWVSEVERMFRTKGMAGFTLHPDKAYLEIKGKLYNRTPHPQTFLWWANPAVAVNDHYQSVFPEDVNAVFDHGKRDVSRFPIATGTYYKVDYSAGVDISRYKNIPVPTSYMAVNSDFDFVGGYENDTRGGLLHIADHHVSPGKKQWTWGNGDFGHAWDRNLTDRNGPYIELMCGVYTDNQPDFSWIQPYEERDFTQYFMPYQEVGVVKNATKDAMLNLTIEDGKANCVVYATGVFPNSRIILLHNNKVLWESVFDLNPESVFRQSIDLSGHVGELSVEVKDDSGRVLVDWKQRAEELKPVPEAAKAAKDPKDIKTNEELYLTGLHIEQYRHATYSPLDYYKEAISRDAGDVRSNNALGLYLMRTGKFEEATVHFQVAIDTLTKFNPNPYDGEPYFNKGVALRLQGKLDEAYDAFFKSCWNAAWQDAGYFNLAQIALIRGDLDKALELVDKSLIRNWHNHKARHLKVAILRKLGRAEQVNALISSSLEIDKFNFGVLFEKYLISRKEADEVYLKELIRDYSHNYLEYALDYAQAGLYEEAIALLKVHTEGKDSVYPMVCYAMGYFHSELGHMEQALNYYKLATQMPTDYCFPNRLEEVVMLQAAIEANSEDDKALYYLGNFWLAKRHYEDARSCWEKSLALNGDSPLVLRNLSLIYYNKFDRKDEAQKLLEKAFALDKSPRLLMELDQLYKKVNMVPAVRRLFLEKHIELVNYRDDVYLEYITLLNMLGEHQKALDLLMSRQFHPWEGGEGKVPAQYILCNVELAKAAISKKEFELAVKYLEAAQKYPHNLGEGKLFGAQENDVFYWLGCAYMGLGDQQKAKDAWNKASEGLSDPSPALYYNDQQPDKIFYQGLALLKLGDKTAALKRFNKLVDYGETHIFDDIKIDYFAVSLPDLLIWDEDLNVRNHIHCNYLIGLGKFGRGEMPAAQKAMEMASEQDLYHLGVHVHKILVDSNEPV
ncbi:DUF5107 domain-containing protein [Echinicola marina]|uniref:tetratricopeptide repeat protein n=1 Tax=Echinicola marina TaxID=2859768 RepID=UPI001CF6DFA0|nr:DUF5107 domain-containing protein [Echinicola marina]UCS93377.1 DUF5107 domain-containing protein [Echinicola marina]